jgi:hypothetical protein
MKLSLALLLLTAPLIMPTTVFGDDDDDDDDRGRRGWYVESPRWVPGPTYWHDPYRYAPPPPVHGRWHWTPYGWQWGTPVVEYRWYALPPHPYQWEWRGRDGDDDDDD